MTDPARFWARVKVGEPSECWPWFAGRDPAGYGGLRWGGKVARAHRVAFALHHGREPVGILRHRCDRPACCNPGHLVEGDHAANVADRVSRGRSAQREQNGRAVLTEQEVRAIRRAYYSREGPSAAKLAKVYGVHTSTVALIVRGKVWRTVVQR